MTSASDYCFDAGDFESAAGLPEELEPALAVYALAVTGLVTERGRTMRNADRFKLHFGPYRPPRFRLGKTVTDEWRGDVAIVGVSNGRIPWPVGKAAGGKSLVVYAGLAKAIRRESVHAVAYWFGVSAQTVTRSRRE